MGVEQLSAHVAAQLGASLRRVAPGAPAGAERLALNLRTLLPALESQLRAGGAAGATALRELSALASTQPTVTLVLPPGGGPARIDAGLRQLTIPAVLRDALLALLDGRGGAAQGGHNTVATGTGAAAGAGASSAGSPMPAASAALPAGSAGIAQAAGPAAAAGWAVGMQANVAAALAVGAGDLLCRAAAPKGGAEREVAPQRFARALLEPLAAGGAAPASAARLQDAVEHSGLFFESHLARWVGGDRSTDAIRRELLALRPSAHDGAPLQALAAPSGERVAAQLEALQRQVVALHGPAWTGQDVGIEIARERPEQDGAPDGSGGDAVFRATLRFALPGLGTLTAHLRLAGDTIAAHVEGDVGRIEPALPALVSALEARGLRPVLVEAKPAQPAEVGP